MESTLDHLVERACEGDEEALEAVVIGIQDRIYNLALRMLWHPSDAEDREHRLAYILSEVFEVRSAQGASILAISENDMLFNGSKNVDGHAFDKPENRPTNLQIPLVRQK